MVAPLIVNTYLFNEEEDYKVEFSEKAIVNRGGKSFAGTFDLKKLHGECVMEVTEAARATNFH